MLIRYCTKCGRQISDQGRIRHRSPYCTEICRREARRELREALDQGKCRPCGRGGRAKPVEEFSGAKAGAQGNLPLETTVNPAAPSTANQGEKHEAI